MPMLGKDAKTYYSSSLLNATDSTTIRALTWTEVDHIVDETDNFNAEVVDVTTRAQASTGFGASVAVLNNIEVTFSYIKEVSDTVWDALWTAIQTPNTPIALLFLSGAKATTTNIGFCANWTFNLNWEKAVKGVQTTNFTARVYTFPAYTVGHADL